MRPLARGRMHESFRQDRCAWCNRIFHICRRCDRGQIYCLPRCRQQGRQRSQRRARKRHQATPEGRLDHRDRQRRYRQRRKKSVTEHGSKGGEAASKMPPVAGTPPPKEGTGRAGAENHDANAPQPAPPGPRPPAAATTARCCLCGRRSVYVRFGWLQHRRQHRSQRCGGPR